MFDPPLPPPPLLSPLEAAAAAAAALAGQAWGYLNSRKSTPGQFGDGFAMNFAGRRNVVIRVRGFDDGGERRHCWWGHVEGVQQSNPWSWTGQAAADSVDGFTLTGVGTSTIQDVCGDGAPTTKTAFVSWRRDGQGGWDALLGQIQVGSVGTGWAPGFFNPQPRITGVAVTGVDVNGVPVQLEPIPDPLYDPPFIPQPELEPEAPQEAPSPQSPAISPAVAAPPGSTPLPVPVEPGVGTGTGTGAGASTAGGGQPLPLRPPVTVPIPPAGQSVPDIGTGTAVARPVPVPNPVTPPGVEEIPGGVIGQPGTSPPPTLEGIASEVGRIEQKVRSVLNRPQPTTDLGPLLDLLQLLLSLLQQVYGPGSYELAPVCEDKDPAVVNWQGGVGAFGQVNVKLDALAALLQAHKDFRQPVCATKASGQPVTVVFEEI